VGGSQGAVEALQKLLSGLPRGFDAAMAVTIHRSPSFRSILADVLSKHSALPVMEAEHGALFRRGGVYLAPADHHLILRNGAMWLDRGPKQHHVRPAIDPMFVSGSRAYGERVIGVLLTGNLSDGVSGLNAIKRRGGLSLAQDPNDAVAPSMPRNAIVYDHVDAIFRMADAAPLLLDLVKGGSLAPTAAS
jgi:two-component system chemotaxis response regulator CheB